ncbi:hemerythrin domain-containing protein [Pelagibacterium halotolerans]|uniref:Coenzyme F420-dependent N5 N10-methylene tetrahydromethanopterin reductase and related flavin-dependent oxidoreductase-like protein n=1 Tax=Pelagibacterium halotolerans (strain DSM 22347 / JCM 15775 / CGMCC 1.7692 / B2) TaxID=1082931 RepID=G4RBV9_PELHB|nr:hemerythrin domain-containing protein [Pelagibacterium halotolerans]AEQ50622.1 coenzyme F420-dependent N5 N10-methylene tetrahydromethanopterin reductase and related flavin-dependent oxidoreductase-like protein [Pelagibacterium halotolerans B2]QJR19439.1 hemerythrin domain-containing protein [Pelagibacterium halotolerans]SDZ91307.1 Hemerythrin HHE cation binding domain-containing protein [Pelagibacterium halotolerans]
MLLDISFLDDATRPRAPKLENLTPQQRAPGQHLKLIHDHLRENVKVLRTMIDDVMAGEKTAEEVEAEAEALTMVSNYRQFGNLCGQHCQTVHMHHSIEDAHIFPALSEKGEAWKKVTDRLQAEHEIVHNLLVKLIAALNALVREPNAANFASATEINDALERVLLSHLGYEEDEIGDALGYFQIGV